MPQTCGLKARVGVKAERNSLLVERLRRAGAIVLGVTFVAGSYVFTDSLKAAFNVLFEQEGAENDLVVREATEFEANRVLPEQTAELWNDSGRPAPGGGLWTAGKVSHLLHGKG